jgi:TP901-1 family phage major tail protein
MAKSGRSVRISRNGSNIVGARTDSVTLNNEPLDITDKDDSGWRTLLADSGLRSLSCEIEGVLKDTVLMADSVGTATTALLKECVVTISGIGTFTGDFYLNSLQIGAEQADVVTFTATLESGESITATIGPYNTVAPAISGTLSGTNTQTTTSGTWAGDATISYAYQWQRGNSSDPNSPSWANIASATATTYALTGSDTGKYIRCRVTATNSVGSTIAYSNIRGPVT